MRVSKTCYEYTDGGSILYPINNVIPVIVKGKGCIGTALVKYLIMKEETTTVGFEFNTAISDTTAKVMYAMYMNNSSMMNDNDDVYSHDVSIPGAVNAPKVNLANKLESGSTKRKIMDDIFGTINGKKNSYYDDEDDF
jgi:Ni,Fe-hydrogenase III small subunit